MRPVRVRVEGFSAYRSAVEMDLTGVDLFSLSGPTGAGKSSLVDAMIFALYGRIPRLGARAVAPAIAAGSDRARVAFEFEVDRVVYTASRVAERTKTGATVREARLEGVGGEPLASGADEVTRSVERLLGLRFDDFTKTVVLPQGEFARFLHAGSAERRELLRDLLGLEVYARVRELAGVRRQVAAERGRSARSQMEEMEVPDEETVLAASRRLHVIQALNESIADRQAALQRVEGELEEARAEASRIGEARQRLAAITPPARLEQLDRLASEAAEAREAAAEEVARRRQQTQEIEERLAALPTLDFMRARREAHRRLDGVEGRLADLDPHPWELRVAEAEGQVEEAGNALEAARQAIDQARANHAAHALAETLAVGDPCPVCRQEVTVLPEADGAEELAGLEQAEQARRQELSSAASALDAARTGLTEVQTRRAELEEQREGLRGELEEGPGLEDLAEAEEMLADLTGRRDQARKSLAEAEGAERQARRRHEELAEAFRSMGRTVVKALQTVADLDPPLSDSDDPVVQWKDLLAWRDSEAGRQTAKEERATARAESLAAEAEKMRRGLVDDLEAAGIPAVEPFVAQVARELEAALHTVEAQERTRERRRVLEEEAERSGLEEKVAATLGSHLRADGFERWLMTGAIGGLVAGANDLLTQLSSGGYTLRADDEGAFAIVDHRNADEVRPVSTLSGGETFLVSLSLALSLAETLSSAGGARLDAIILDEGFGTLDEESLDTVATVLEELAGRGLMVGVITHVKELAARAAVRFEVSRDPGGSKVVAVS